MNAAFRAHSLSGEINHCPKPQSSGWGCLGRRALLLTASPSILSRALKALYSRCTSPEWRRPPHPPSSSHVHFSVCYLCWKHTCMPGIEPCMISHNLHPNLTVLVLHLSDAESEAPREGRGHGPRDLLVNGGRARI